MSTNEPPQAITEAAIADLLRLTFVRIRFLSSPLVGDPSRKGLIKRQDRIHWMRSRWDQVGYDYR